MVSINNVITSAPSNVNDISAIKIIVAIIINIAHSIYRYVASASH